MPSYNTIIIYFPMVFLFGPPGKIWFIFKIESSTAQILNCGVILFEHYIIKPVTESVKLHLPLVQRSLCRNLIWIGYCAKSSSTYLIETFSFLILFILSPKTVIKEEFLDKSLSKLSSLKEKGYGTLFVEEILRFSDIMKNDHDKISLIYLSIFCFKLCM